MRAIIIASIVTTVFGASVAGYFHEAEANDRAFPVKHPQPLTEVRVIAFKGGFNLPIWAAQRQGFFAREGLEARLSFTPNSVYQITNLLADRYDIAMTAFDNVVAYQEDQGEADIPDEIDSDLFVFLGSDDAFLSISAQSEIRKVTDLRGKTLTVDAMTTGFAFVLREILERYGVDEKEVRFVRAGGVVDRFRDMLKNPEHAATTQVTPFDLLGEMRGFNTLVRVRDVLGEYQGISGVARRSWANANRQLIIGFIRAYQDAIDWLYDRDNRKIAEALLVANVGGMTPELAAATYNLLLDEEDGFYRKVKPNVAGIRTVLALRSKYGIPRKELNDPMKYVDLSYYETAAED